MRGEHVASFKDVEFHSNYSTSVGRIAGPVDPAVNILVTVMTYRPHVSEEFL